MACKGNCDCKTPANVYTKDNVRDLLKGRGLTIEFGEILADLIINSINMNEKNIIDAINELKRLVDGKIDKTPATQALSALSAQDIMNIKGKLGLI